MAKVQLIDFFIHFYHILRVNDGGRYIDKYLFFSQILDICIHILRIGAHKKKKKKYFIYNTTKQRNWFCMNDLRKKK